MLSMPEMSNFFCLENKNSKISKQLNVSLGWPFKTERFLKCEKYEPLATNSIINEHIHKNRDLRIVSGLRYLQKFTTNECTLRRTERQNKFIHEHEFVKKPGFGNNFRIVKSAVNYNYNEFHRHLSIIYCRPTTELKLKRA